MAETMKLTVDTGAVQVDVEDKDGKKPERKDDGEEPKVRSLHHIDDDDYDY